MRSGKNNRGWKFLFFSYFFLLKNKVIHSLPWRDPYGRQMKNYFQMHFSYFVYSHVWFYELCKQNKMYFKWLKHIEVFRRLCTRTRKPEIYSLLIAQWTWKALQTFRPAAANGKTGKQSPWVGKSQIFDMAPDSTCVNNHKSEKCSRV